MAFSKQIVSGSVLLAAAHGHQLRIQQKVQDGDMDFDAALAKSQEDSSEFFGPVVFNKKKDDKPYYFVEWGKSSGNDVDDLFKCASDTGSTRESCVENWFTKIDNACIVMQDTPYADATGSIGNLLAAAKFTSNPKIKDSPKLETRRYYDFYSSSSTYTKPIHSSEKGNFYRKYYSTDAGYMNQCMEAYKNRPMSSFCKCIICLLVVLIILVVVYLVYTNVIAK